MMARGGAKRETSKRSSICSASASVRAGRTARRWTAALGSGLRRRAYACSSMKGAPADGAGRGRRKVESCLRPQRERYPISRNSCSNTALQSMSKTGMALRCCMQAAITMAPAADRDRMVEWLLSKGADPNAKSDRGETAYLLASRAGAIGAMEILAKAGAQEMKDEWPVPSRSARCAYRCAESAAVARNERRGFLQESPLRFVP